MKPTFCKLAFATALMLAASVRSEALVGATTPGEGLASTIVMVLNRTAAGAGFCSGIIIARNVVLTAAHCLAAARDMRVYFRDAGDRPVLMEVMASAAHPLYRAAAPRRRERSIDLALLRTEAPLPASFRAASLDRGTALAVGTSVRIAGFGVTREGAGSTAGKLRVGRLEVRAPLSSILLWADDPAHKGAGACTGDSGGPVLAVTSDLVVAVTDWATGAGSRHCGQLTQAALVAPQRFWIDAVLSRWQKERPR